MADDDKDEKECEAEAPDEKPVVSEAEESSDAVAEEVVDAGASEPVVQHRGSYRWPLTILGLGLIALVGYVFTIQLGERAIEKAADGGTRFVEKMGEAAEKFTTGTVRQSFVAHLPEVSSTGGGKLQLASLKSVETFRDEHVKTIAWDYISLGTTVAEIQVPVTYRYQLDLSEDWKIDVSGNTCIVHAPRIRPELPPAIHTDGMLKRSSEGWLRFDGEDRMSELERKLTPTLEIYARDVRRIGIVREEARKTVAKFIRDWLLQEDFWRTDRFSSIKVVFADETEEEVSSPTLRLEVGDSVTPALN